MHSRYLDGEAAVYGGTNLIERIARLVWRLERYGVVVSVGLAMIAFVATLTSFSVALPKASRDAYWILAIGGIPYILHGAITAAMARASRVAKRASLASSLIVTTVSLTFALLIAFAPKGGETTGLSLFLEGVAMIIAALAVPPIAYFFFWLENR